MTEGDISFIALEHWLQQECDKKERKKRRKKRDISFSQGLRVIPGLNCTWTAYRSLTSSPTLADPFKTVIAIKKKKTINNAESCYSNYFIKVIKLSIFTY